MGASTKKSGFQGPALFAAQQQQIANSKEQEQKAAAQKQYEVDKRSQYESLPQSLRDKVSFEDAYADRGPAATREKTRNLSSLGSEPNYADRGPAATREAIQGRQGIGRDSRSEYFDLDQFNRLKAEVDQRQSGIKRQSGNPDLSYFDDTLNSLESMKKNYDQQRSSNNAGIAFGPGRSNRGNISLARQLKNRMQR